MIDYDKVFITGGNGLVGSCVTGKHRPSSKEVNLLNYDETLSYMQENKIEYVVHCAARVGGVKENMEVCFLMLTVIKYIMIKEKM